MHFNAFHFRLLNATKTLILMRDLQLQLAVELTAVSQLNFVGNWAKMGIHVGDVEVTHLQLENFTREIGTEN